MLPETESQPATRTRAARARSRRDESPRQLLRASRARSRRSARSYELWLKSRDRKTCKLPCSSRLQAHFVMDLFLFLLQPSERWLLPGLQGGSRVKINSKTRAFR